jgi:hypothetical protein
MVWILTWENPTDGETAVTVWDTDNAARKQACSEIQDDILNGWDMTDYEAASQAKLINDAIARCNYSRAMEYYNEWQSDRDYGTFYYVCEKSLLTPQDARDPDVFDEDFFEALVSEDDDEDEEDEEEDEEVDDSPYQASVPGATCRGPCKSYNNMAYADKRDGTYCCYQCKTFSHIFGKKP